MNRTIDAVDAGCCPLCGNANQCGMVTGEEKCWCFNAVISEDVLARVPEQARDLVCICEKCANRSGAI